MLECCKPRYIRFGRWGLAEDPTGQHVIDHLGRPYTVTGTYRKESPSVVMLTVKHFDGSNAEDIAASYARILPHHYHEDNG